MNYSQEYWDKNPSFHKEDAPRKFQEITSLINFTPKSILDIGCGAGFLTDLIYKKYKPERMLGVDISQEVIKVAKKSASKEIEFKAIDFSALKLDKKFDLGIVADLIEHLEDDKAFIKKATSICEKLVIRIPLEKNFYNDFLKKIGISDEYATFRDRYGHIHHYNVTILKKLVNSENIRIEDYKIFPLGRRTKIINNIAVYISKIVRLLSPRISADLFGGFIVMRISNEKS